MKIWILFQSEWHVLVLFSVIFRILHSSAPRFDYEERFYADDWRQVINWPSGDLAPPELPKKRAFEIQCRQYLHKIARDGYIEERNKAEQKRVRKMNRMILKARRARGDKVSEEVKKKNM